MSDPDPSDIVRMLYGAWVRQDIDFVLAHLTEDAVYTLHIDDDAMPTGGRATGRDHIRARLMKHLDIFEPLLYRPGQLVTDGDIVRARVEYWYRHRASGHDINGFFRQVWCFAGTMVLSIDEYHDAAKFAAFMRLVEQTPRPPRA